MEAHGIPFSPAWPEMGSLVRLGGSAAVAWYCGKNLSVAATTWTAVGARFSSGLHRPGVRGTLLAVPRSNVRLPRRKPKAPRAVLPEGHALALADFLYALR